MAATLISAAAVTLGNSGDPAGVSVTVPADCTLAIVTWSYWDSTTGGGILTATLDGNAFNDEFELVSTTTDTGTGAISFKNPSTGTVTLDIDWDLTGTLDEGPTCIIHYIKDSDLSGVAWSDADADAATGTTAVTVTLTTTTTSLVIKHDQRFSGTTPPSTSTGWTSTATQTANSESARSSTCDSPGASTTVCDSEDENYSSVCALAIPPAAGGATNPKGPLNGISLRGPLQRVVGF